MRTQTISISTSNLNFKIQKLKYKKFLFFIAFLKIIFGQNTVKFKQQIE